MKLDKIVNKKRRLRKKLFLGEFQQFGMRVHCELSCADLDAVGVLLNDLIDVMHEYNLLICVDAGPQQLNAVIWPNTSYSSITDAHQQIVGCWLQQRQEVRSVDLPGKLDVHHDPL